MIQYFALVEDYFDENKKERVFICDDCGCLVGNDFIEKHQQFHEQLDRIAKAASRASSMLGPIA